VGQFEYEDGEAKVDGPYYFKSDLIWPDSREAYLEGTRYEGDQQTSTAGRDGVRGRQGGDLAQLRRLAEEAIGRRQSWIDNAASARERQRRNREVLAEKAPGAAGSGEREYGTAGAYSAQALGAHYSKERRRTLTTDHYGTGMKGKEADRLSGPDSEDLRQRLYFYVDAGRGIKQIGQDLSNKEVQKVIDKSGLYGLSFGDGFIEAYFVGDVKNEPNRKNFDAAIQRADQYLGAGAGGAGRSVARLWPYGYGEGTIGYDRIRGDLPAGQATFSKTARRVAEYLNHAAGLDGPVKSFQQAQQIDPKQAALQASIARAYESLPDNDLKNPRVRKAYAELAKELLRQYSAIPIKLEVYKGEGEPYVNSRAMRRDMLDNNHLFIFGTNKDSFGPEGADFTGHPLLEDTGLFDANGYRPTTMFRYHVLSRESTLFSSRLVNVLYHRSRTVQLEHRLDAAVHVTLVATCQIPDQWPALESSKHSVVAFCHLNAVEHTAQRIVDMRIGAGLVDHQIDILAVLDGSIQPSLKRALMGVKFTSAGKMRAHRVMLDPVHAERLHDVVGAVAVVHIAVENSDAPHITALQQGHGGHHQAVEGAKALGDAVTGVVKAAGGRTHVFTLIQRMASGCQQRTIGVRQGGRHRRVEIVEAVGDTQVEHTVHKVTVMGALEVGAAERLKADHIGAAHQATGQPVFHHQRRLGGRRRKSASVAGRLFWAIKHFHAGTPCL
jgi:hypothetical protein